MAPIDPTYDASDDKHAHDAASSGDSGVHGGTLAPIASTNGNLPSLSHLNWSYGPPPRPEILSAKPNPLELLHAVRRRWPLALGLGTTVAVIAAGLLWFLLPVKYEAFALLNVRASEPAVLEKGRSASEEFTVFKRTQVQLILSTQVLNGVLRSSDINRLSIVKENPDNPVSWLRDQLVIDYPDDAEIMRLAMKGKDADEVVKIVDRIVDVYMKEIVEAAKLRRVAAEAKLRDAFDKETSEYTKKVRELNQLAATHKTKDSSEAQFQKQLALEELNAKLEERQHLLDDLAETEVEILMAQTRQEHPEHARPPDAMVEAALSEDPVVAKLVQNLGAHQDYLNQVRTHVVSPDVPVVRELQRTILHLEESIEERKTELRPRLMEAMVAATLKKKEELFPLSKEHLEKKKAFLAQKLKSLEEEITVKTDVVQKLEQFSADVAAKQEEVEQSKMIKTQLGAELERLGVERLAEDRIIVIDKAILENSRGDAMRKYIGVVFTALLSFFGVVLGVAIYEFQSRKVNSVAEVNDGLGIRVLGELPSIRGRAFRRVRGGKGPAVLKALMAERIDGTRTALIHTTAIDPPRVVMVTSAEPHEGKTTTSSQLAASLARSGRRTLLVDADIRNPGIHRVFELPQDPGLSELLRGETERDAAIHPTRTANLWLMPAGRCDLRSVQALSSSFLGTTIASLSVQFDYVVIDAGPVLKVTDPLLVGQHVDAAIVSVLRDVSKVPRVYEAVERLRSVGITVLGSVVNGVKDDVARHGVELLMAETPAQAQAEAAAASPGESV